MTAMPVRQQTRLTPDERRARQKLYLRDTAALGTLLGIAIVLSFTTYLLFHSFSNHREMLQERWRVRGEKALAAGQPQVALNDLHSALAYAPDDRGLQVELAMALAAGGRTAEAGAYFNTLLEAEPGSGLINLQLARLAVRTANPQGAVDHYQAAIDGTWNGDAFTRRREIRLELARYLIAQHRDAEARSILLITSGNGPDNLPLQLEVGGLLLAANDPADALDVYKKAGGRRAPTRTDALLGEARAAGVLGRFAAAKAYYSEAMGEPAFARQPEAVRNAAHDSLHAAEVALALFPALSLPSDERAHRIAHLAELARARLLNCPAAAPPPLTPQAAPPQPGSTSPIAGLAAQLQQLNPLARQPLPPQNAPPPSPTEAVLLPTFTARWAALPTGDTLVKQLARDPAFAQDTLALAYGTERAANGPCPAPSGDDALLLKIAQAPDQVEAQP